MFWAICMYWDANASPGNPPPTPEEIVGRFLMTLALWPWPIPWMVENMANIVDRRPVDGAAIDTMDRRITF